MQSVVVLIQRHFVLLMVALFFSSISWAQNSGMKNITYTISPLLGYETVFRSTPTPHTATHAMYGARLTVGSDLISGELEYTNGSDTENYSVAPQSVKSTDEKVKLGARSTLKLTDLFNMSLRLGGQAKRTTEESTSNGVTTSEQKPIEYAPYAGAAFGIHLGKLNIAIGTTVVIKDINDMEKNEYQNAISIGMGL